MKRMYQIIQSTAKCQKENAGRLLVLVSMILGGLIGGVLALLIPALSSQMLNLCALGLLLGCVWSLVALLNM